jgi:hypothetical protein
MARIPTARYPICPLCTEHVELETAMNNQNGRAVHEDCYVAFILAKGRIYASIRHSLLVLCVLAKSEHDRAVA